MKLHDGIQEQITEAKDDRMKLLRLVCYLGGKYEEMNNVVCELEKLLIKEIGDDRYNAMCMELMHKIGGYVPEPYDEEEELEGEV